MADAPDDPGYLYIIRNGDMLKIGKSKDRESRIRAARTWLPDMQLIGVKPFWCIGYLEQCLHVGLAQFWYAKEWFDFKGDEFLEELIEGWREFYDAEKCRDQNSLNFVYWFNSSGMNELTLEWSSRRQSGRAFMRETSGSQQA